MKVKQKSRGITLIALVITIIVLLILAGVSIATLGGDSGIISRARNSSTKTKEKQSEEEAILMVNEYEIYKKRCENEGKEINVKDFLDSNYKDKYEEQDGKYKITTESGGNLEIDDNGNVKLNEEIINQTDEKSKVEDLASVLVNTQNARGKYIQYDAGGLNSWRVLYLDSSNIYIICNGTVGNASGFSSRDKLVNYVRNTSNWNNYAIPDYAISATGAPTMSEISKSLGYSLKGSTTYQDELIFSVGSDWVMGEPFDEDGSGQQVFVICSWGARGMCYWDSAIKNVKYRPLVKLKSGIKTKGGDGTAEKPFILVSE